MPDEKILIVAKRMNCCTNALQNVQDRVYHDIAVIARLESVVFLFCAPILPHVLQRCLIELLHLHLMMMMVPMPDQEKVW